MINYCFAHFNDAMKVLPGSEDSRLLLHIFKTSIGCLEILGEEQRVVGSGVIVVKAGASLTSCGAMFGMVREREQHNNSPPPPGTATSTDSDIYRTLNTTRIPGGRE